MQFGKFHWVTTIMIYLGTLLLSILSFFTTLYGLAIIVSMPLALLGSLGLQTAMLGIAWNLIRIQEKRGTYLSVFAIAASFSIFFSYANFDISLKAETRPYTVRKAYNEDVRPVLTEYSTRAKQAVSTARYQVDRLNNIIRMEREKGWATVVDEGSQDRYIQSIINGARLTVDSWNKNQNTDYRQGRGDGIIVNYLEGRVTQAENNHETVINYSRLVDSLSLAMRSDMTVQEQCDLVNLAYISFPSAEVGTINLDTATPPLPAPPVVASHDETPVNKQQALMMVLSDLVQMDRLVFISLMLAVSIDLIVILMALAGSYATAHGDFVFRKVAEDAARRLSRLSLDDVRGFGEILDDNLIRQKKAAEYSKELSKIVDDHKRNRKNALILAKKRKNTGLSQSEIYKAKSRIATLGQSSSIVDKTDDEVKTQI